MLLKSKITGTPMYSGEHYFSGWLNARIGKFTASKIACCMQPKGIGDTGMAYIRSRAFEELNGISSEKEVDTEAMRWGLLYEPEALKAFVRYKNIPIDEMGRVPIIVQKLVCDKDSKFGCTPDGIWVQQELERDGETFVVVAPGEVKCYQLAKHLKCVMCDTPEKIKAVDPDAYWQLVMQMDECGALVGYLIYYYPGLKYGGLRVIEFRKVEMVSNVKIGEINDFKLFNNRKIEIMNLYQQEKEILMNIKN
jgi:hypothetical protein